MAVDAHGGATAVQGSATAAQGGATAAHGGANAVNATSQGYYCATEACTVTLLSCMHLSEHFPE